jgi:transcriptional regulator with XRE-family HTH domain
MPQSQHNVVVQSIENNNTKMFDFFGDSLCPGVMKKNNGVHAVKLLREKNDESQKVVAAILGITQQHVALIEQGHRSLQYDQAEKLASHWGVKVLDLLGYILTKDEKESWVIETYREAPLQIKDIVDKALAMVQEAVPAPKKKKS